MLEIDVDGCMNFYQSHMRRTHESCMYFRCSFVIESVLDFVRLVAGQAPYEHGGL